MKIKKFIFSITLIALCLMLNACSKEIYTVNFMVENESIEITAGSFIKLIKSVNNLFSKIVCDIRKYAYENKKDDYLYYRRIIRFDFTDFNKIYDNDILRIVGKIMKKF